MKILFSFGVALILGSASNLWASDFPQPEEVSVPITGAYIPGGFDSNDSAEVTVEGYFPNSCYRLGQSTFEVNKESGEVLLKQTAYVYKNGFCLEMIVPFSQTVKVGMLKAQDYKVVDSLNGRVLGQLPVAEAKNVGPDDYMYATVKDAYLDKDDGDSDRSVILRGELPNSCWKLKDKRIILDGKNVISVLPIIEKDQKQKVCSESAVKFKSSAELPKISSGRYLLNVRSLNGQAITKLIDL